MGYVTANAHDESRTGPLNIELSACKSGQGSRRNSNKPGFSRTMAGPSPFRGVLRSGRSLAGDASRRTSRVRVVNLSPTKAPGPQELAEYGKAMGMVGVNVDR